MWLRLVSSSYITPIMTPKSLLFTSFATPKNLVKYILINSFSKLILWSYFRWNFDELFWDFFQVALKNWFKFYSMSTGKNLHEN